MADENLMSAEQLSRVLDQEDVHPETMLLSLQQHIPVLLGPVITKAQPLGGPPGTIIEITGSRFAAKRIDNNVRIGGLPATVLSASATSLKVMPDAKAVSGIIEVQVGALVAKGPAFRIVHNVPRPTGDGWPIDLIGTAQSGLAGDQPPAGTLNVLVMLVHSQDVVPSVADAAAARVAVLDAWNKATLFYRQASYEDGAGSGLTVAVTVTNDFLPIAGNGADFVKADPGHPTERGYDNFDNPSATLCLAEACKAHSASFKSTTVSGGSTIIDNTDYQVLAVVLYLGKDAAMKPRTIRAMASMASGGAFALSFRTSGFGSTVLPNASWNWR